MRIILDDPINVGGCIVDGMFLKQSYVDLPSTFGTLSTKIDTFTYYKGGLGANSPQKLTRIVRESDYSPTTALFML